MKESVLYTGLEIATQKKVESQGGWPNEDLMEKHFPGLDNRLRDLREWLLTRVGDNHKAVWKGVIHGINGGIK